MLLSGNQDSSILYAKRGGGRRGGCLLVLQGGLLEMWESSRHQRFSTRIIPQTMLFETVLGSEPVAKNAQINQKINIFQAPQLL